MSGQPGSLRQNLRLLPRSAWVLYGGTFVNRFGSFVAVFLVLYMTHRGYAPAQAGLAVAAFGLGAIPASPVSGFLADRVGRRETIVLASLMAAAFTMALVFASTLPQLVLFAGLAGMANQMFRAPSAALLADLVPPERRMTAVGVMRLATNAGFALGPAAAGLIADRSFNVLFVADAATSLVFGAVALSWLPRGAPTAEPGPAAARGSTAILHDRPLVIFLLASMAMGVVYAQTSTGFPLWVHDNGFSNAVYGALIGINGAAIVMVELVLVNYLQRFSARRVIVAGFVLVSLGFTLTAAAHTLVALAATVLVWTAGEMLAFPAGGVYVANASPLHLRGRYVGAWGLAWAIGWTVGPLAGSWLYQRNPVGLWLACGAIGAAATVVVTLLPDTVATAEPRPAEAVQGGAGPGKSARRPAG